MNILQINGISEVSIGTLNNIYEIYQSQGDKFVHDRMADYTYFTFIETLWHEPRLWPFRTLFKSLTK